MQVSNIEAADLFAAARDVGVALDVRTLNAKGTRHQVKVNPIVPDTARTPRGARRRGEAGDARYQRLSAGYGRELTGRVHAVCWHGFRDFFRACFERAPNAVFRTSLDTWRGSEDFEARYRESGHRNIGSQISPIMAAEACRCGEEGLAV